MKRYSILLAGVLTAPAHALVNIDQFDTGAINIERQSGSQLVMANGSMLGGDRYVRVDVDSNPLSRKVNATTGDGFLSIDSGANLAATTSVGWGYKPNPNNALGVLADDLNVNLTGEDRFRLTALFNDHDIAMKVFVLSNGIGASSAMHTLPGSIAPSTNFDFMFSEFQNINFASVDQIVIHIYGTPASDTVIDNLSAVPEPATFIALGTGVLALLKRRQRA